MSIKNLTVEQVAEIMHITPYTCRKWLNEGKLPGYRFGQRWRVIEAELIDWMREQRNNSAKE